MWQGGTIEADTMASCNDTTDQMTLSTGLKNGITSTQASANRIQVFEMQEFVPLSNVGTSRVVLGDIYIAGPYAGPVAAWANTASGTTTIEWFTVEAR
jgi:hypothetical protein